ncbi:MAG TPA: MaoC/PaaZ C-terminal domain-containing protein [Solirubrobacterales bacterium]|nr:MaoC/PaaZ C-terminal domain-containing protein [Solirubrobacterales bacterium]
MSSATVENLAGYDLGSHTHAYTESDAILFALAVGAGREELRWVYEQDLRVMPTFGMALGLWAVRASGATGAYDPVKTLHVGQRLRVHRPLPASATLEMSGTVAAVWDKGSAALVEVLVSSDYFDATYSIFVPGMGGFGGERGAAQPAPEAVDAEEQKLRVQTTESQAALYRLTGDLHPIHIDPAVAQANGFERPILHGLCTLACVVKAVADADADGDLEAIEELAARFSGPVFPGDAIEAKARRGEETIVFAAETDGKVVLKDAWIRF